MKYTALASFSLPLLALSLAGCTDPVGDAPRATVTATPETATAAPPEQAPEGAPTYVFSQDGSKISFVGAKVTKKHDGGFTKFKGSIEAPGGKVEGAKVDVTIDMASVFTDVEKLTGHLKSPDFFDVASIPTARFVSSAIKANADGTSTVTGDLPLHGVTKRITFPAKITTSDSGASVSAEFGINRKDFGIVYPGAPDDLIADEVLLKLDVNARKGGA